MQRREKKVRSEGFDMDNNNEIDQEVDAVMEIATEGQVDNRSSKRKCLIFLLIVALIEGFLVGILPEDSGYLTILEFVARVFI